MKKMKLVLLAAALCMAVSPASAAVVTAWSNAGGDGVFSNGANWTGGVSPDYWDSWGIIDAGAPVIDASTNVPGLAAYALSVANGVVGEVTLTQIGGTMRTGSPGVAAAFDGLGWFSVGGIAGANGTFNMQDGIMDSTWDFIVGHGAGGNGTVNQTGGAMYAHRLMVGTGAGAGLMNLDGGALVFTHAITDGLTPLTNGNYIDVGPNGLIDMTDGQMHIVGNDISGSIQALIDANKIVGYGGAGSVLIDYDNMIPGVTVVYAVPEPATMMLLGLGGVLLRRRK